MFMAVGILFMLMSIIFLAGAVLGLIKPSWGWKFGRATRAKAFWGNMILFVGCMVITGSLGIADSKQEKAGITKTAGELEELVVATKDSVSSFALTQPTNAGTSYLGFESRANLVLILGILTGVLIVVLFLVVYNRFQMAGRYRVLRDRYSGIVDIEGERAKIAGVVANLGTDYKKKKGFYDRLVIELGVVEESLDFVSFGVYEPHYDFSDSEAYKIELKKVREGQKALIKAKKAAVCDTEWQVGGSKAKGRKMTNQSIKLMVRAFNGECDAAIAKVAWNNVDRMEARISKAHEAINKLGQSNMIYITQDYLKLKMEELFLVHEFKEKRQREKEEQAEIRALMREEEKARRDAEKKEREAAAEEARAIKALEKAKTEVQSATGKQLELLQKMIEEFETKLLEAKDAKQKAISWAQLTKQGHVYVISNVGSFGEDVYKIGLTRRLDPLDRVKELGDASVPFTFDVHAMIYSKNAPALESALHEVFEDRRVNMVNHRKEFFNASLDDIEEAVMKKADSGEKVKITFTKVAEARDFRETVAMKQGETRQQQGHVSGSDGLPAAI